MLKLAHDASTARIASEAVHDRAKEFRAGAEQRKTANKRDMIKAQQIKDNAKRSNEIDIVQAREQWERDETSRLVTAMLTADRALAVRKEALRRAQEEVRVLLHNAEL
jgi:hypothetical protein